MNDRLDEPRQQYGCGPVQSSGADEALYNRQPEQAIQQTH